MAPGKKAGTLTPNSVPSTGLEVRAPLARHMGVGGEMMLGPGVLEVGLRHAALLCGLILPTRLETGPG